MPILLIVSVILMIWFNYKITQRIINVITVLTLPYAVLIPINNYVMYRFGFYLIKDEVILMILGAFLCIFIGSLIADIPYSKKHDKKGGGSQIVNIGRAVKSEKESRYKWAAMIRYVWFVNILTFFRLLLIILRRGLNYIGTEDFSGALTSGLLGHLFLSITPLVPILLYYWLNHKRSIQYLITAIVSVALFFLTFVKYHVIGIAVASYLLISYENRKYIRKGGIILVAGGTAVFILNYFFSFFLRGVASNVNSNYYFFHFWNYASGSFIYDNRIFEQGIRVGTSIFYKLGTFIFAPVNLFTNAIFNYRFFPHEPQPHYLVATNGQIGNVVDAIGYLYPSKGTIIDIFIFAIIMLFIGCVFTLIYNHNADTARKRNTYPTVMVYFLSYFVFLSFFGTFYINSVPYEILFWCWLMMKIFDKRVRFVLGSRRIL